MKDSENDKLIVRNVHALLPCVSKQIAITNKLLAQIDDIEKWWEELEPAWKEIFFQELKLNVRLIDKIDDWEKWRKEIDKLYINHKNVPLEIIRHVRNLESVSCWGTKITTLEPIRSLTNLESLSCFATGVTTLEPIRSLTNLKILYCGGPAPRKMCHL